MRRGAAALAVLAGAGVSLAASVSTLGRPDPAAGAAQALAGRLEAKRLSVRWIRCLESEQTFRGAPAFRCTVNFGDPHLVPYCVAPVDGAFVTDRDLPEIRCYPPAEEARYRANVR